MWYQISLRIKINVELTLVPSLWNMFLFIMCVFIYHVSTNNPEITLVIKLNRFLMLLFAQLLMNNLMWAGGVDSV